MKPTYGWKVVPFEFPRGVTYVYTAPDGTLYRDCRPREQADLELVVALPHVPAARLRKLTKFERGLLPDRAPE